MERQSDLRRTFEDQFLSSGLVEIPARVRRRSPLEGIAQIALSLVTTIAIGASMVPRWMYGQTQTVFKATASSAIDCRSVSRSYRSPRVTRTAQGITFQASLVGDIVAFAYDLPLDHIERRPQWMYDECYDVEVTATAPSSLPSQKQMLKKLLEEHFGLVAHEVSYPSPVYFLVRGPKVNLTQTVDPDDEGIPDFRILPLQPGYTISYAVYAKHISMTDLAGWLYRQLQLPVLDKTGITGVFDIEITGISPRGAGDTITRAVRDSLGLVLEMHEGTAESLVIDHVEKPKEN